MKPMKSCTAVPLAVGTLAVVCAVSLQRVDAQADDPAFTGSSEQKLVLTPAQRRTVYSAVTKERSKAPLGRFPPVIGADVPPMIEPNPLPDEAVADNPTAKFYEYTVVQDRVVLVDPTKMRVVDVIGPNP
ncbi:MAG: DUF1236 domain-containing protein [Xanthobacteraceae bacterium]